METTSVISDYQIARFHSRVYKTDKCWYWVGAKGSKGYGSMYLSQGRYMLAHRLSYLIHHGPIPNDRQVDHVCHSLDKDCPGGACSHRRCVNPAHLEAVTSLENTSRGRKKDSALDECKHGHKYTSENTRIDRRDGARVCVACNRDKQRRFRTRRCGDD